MVRIFSLLAVLLACLPLAAQDNTPATETKKFPEPGSKVPIQWPVINLNGDRKDCFHCPICKFNLKPVVMVIAKEPAPEALWKTLAPKLEELIEKQKEENQLRAFFVLTSPDAKTSAGGAEVPEADFDKLVVEELNARLKLFERIRKQIPEETKQIIVAAFTPNVPEKLNLDPKAEVTVVFYNRYDVVASWSFEEGKFTPEEAEKVVGTVQEKLSKKKKL